jgi:hypothetical protein
VRKVGDSQRNMPPEAPTPLSPLFSRRDSVWVLGAQLKWSRRGCVQMPGDGICLGTFRRK